MIITSDALGDYIKSDGADVFFGNKKSRLLLEQGSIHFGHQVHKQDLVQISTRKSLSSHLIQDSDGLWTSEVKLKLGIYTADCAPCFIYSAGKLFSLHLGWRSLQLGLLDKALNKIDPSKQSLLFIGPHIQASSFEVGREVWEKFKNLPILFNKECWFNACANNKFQISLSAIIKLKATNYKVETYSSTVDTLSSEHHHSYRGENGTRERNISFAFLK